MRLETATHQCRREEERNGVLCAPLYRRNAPGRSVCNQAAVVSRTDRERGHHEEELHADQDDEQQRAEVVQPHYVLSFRAPAGVQRPRDESGQRERQHHHQRARDKPVREVAEVESPHRSESTCSVQRDAGAVQRARDRAVPKPRNGDRRVQQQELYARQEIVAVAVYVDHDEGNDGRDNSDVPRPRRRLAGRLLLLQRKVFASRLAPSVVRKGKRHQSDRTAPQRCGGAV